MTKFGSLKTKILHNLTESYIAGDKKRTKEILKILKENRDFKELYLFYEEIEGMYLDDKEVAKVYVESVETLLKSKVKKVSKYCKQVEKTLTGDYLVEVEVYKNLDSLVEDDSLKNVDKKILGKKKLVEFLTTKKDLSESSNDYTDNEHLLHFVLAERFNNDFEKMLSEEDKLKLSEILSMSNETLENEFNTLKEEVSGKIDDMTLNESDSLIKDKLDLALKESQQMPPTKHNYYKLQQLRNGL